jgi:phenylacetate-CoA ligase
LGRDYWQLRSFLQESQWWERDRSEAWQLQKLKDIATYAYENVPGYYHLYRDAGIRPDDILSLEDIRRLPFTTKQLLRENEKDFVTRSIPVEELKYDTTGGSTGEPLGFYHTETNGWMEKAFIHTGWERAGWRLGESSAVLRGRYVGTPQRFWDYNRANRELLLSSWHLSEDTFPEYVQKMRDFQVHFIQAYPSMIMVLADMLLDSSEPRCLEPVAILLGSEQLYDWQEGKLREAFPDTRLFAWYGQSEQAILAPMCEASNQYHVWPFYGYAEILDHQDNEVTTGGVGELVGTSFWSHGTPFIRYRTTDMAAKGEFGCQACGRQHQLIESIEGRLQDYVITKDRARITATAFNLLFDHHYKAFGEIRNVQLYQDTVGEVVVRVVPRKTLSQESARDIKDRTERAAGGKIDVHVQVVDSIARTARGKYRFVEQKLQTESED